MCYRVCRGRNLSGAPRTWCSDAIRVLQQHSHMYPRNLPLASPPSKHHHASQRLVAASSAHSIWDRCVDTFCQLAFGLSICLDVRLDCWMSAKGCVDCLLLHYTGSARRSTGRHTRRSAKPNRRQPCHLLWPQHQQAAEVQQQQVPCADFLLLHIGWRVMKDGAALCYSGLVLGNWPCHVHRNTLPASESATRHCNSGLTTGWNSSNHTTH